MFFRTPCVTLKACIEDRPLEGESGYSKAFETWVKGTPIRSCSSGGAECTTDEDCDQKGDQKDENVALGKQTNVSSTFYSNTAGSALDGNPDTFFHSDSSPSDDEYFQVDLGQNYRVGR